MPIDLNKHDLKSFTDRVQALPPGRALVTDDGLVVRRLPRSSGYECGVGRGGFGHHRANTAHEAAEFTLVTSAKLEDPTSLGGKTSFKDYEVAIESVRKGEALPTGPSPAVKALRRVAVKAGLHSYRVRAQQARDALAKGNVDGAVRQMEAIIEHAGNNGRLKDVERAQEALNTIYDHHDFVGELPQLTSSKIEVRTIGTKHHVFKDGNDVTGPMERQDAEKRRDFLTKQAARREAVAAIDREISELPESLRRDDEPAAA